jgi:hypothetical protein
MNNTSRRWSCSLRLQLLIAALLFVGSAALHEDGTQRTLQSSETQRVNIFQKLGESLGTSIVGFILICLMPILIWKNEGRHARELQRIEFAKNEAVAVDWYVIVGRETSF